jgi:pyrroline-5-carboxylate reductase
MQLTGRVVFVGAGNMANALIEGLLAAGTCTSDTLGASDVNEAGLQALRDKHGVEVHTDNSRAVRDAAVVVLSVKPQVFPSLLPELAGALPSGCLVISIAAGISIAVIEAALPAGTRVVRAMPNTPALVQAGATAIAPGRAASAADMDTAERIFRSVGVTVRVAEAQLDAVTGLSGSGPGYVFRMIEAMTEAGTAVGLSPADAALLSAETVYGAAKLLRESSETPAVLRQRVTSPGGTTQAGLERLEARGFMDVIRDAVVRATERAGELGKEAAARLAGR